MCQRAEHADEVIARDFVWIPRREIDFTARYCDVGLPVRRPVFRLELMRIERNAEIGADAAHIHFTSPSRPSPSSELAKGFLFRSGQFRRPDWLPRA